MAERSSGESENSDWQVKLPLSFVRQIRSNQGHSIPVDVELEKLVPPDVLYHGTAEKFTESIDREGLIPGSRLYVHLSKDESTAAVAGKRHGRLVIYRIDCRRMHLDGYDFYCSVNNVWLTKKLPAKYLTKLS